MKSVKVAPLAPFRFNGDTEMNCRLVKGPVLDLGIIFDRTKIDVQMRAVSGKVVLPKRADLKIAYFYDLKTESTTVLEAGETQMTDPAKGVLVSVFAKL